MYVLKHKKSSCVTHTFLGLPSLLQVLFFPIFPRFVKLCISPLTYPSQPWHIQSSSGCRKYLPFLYHTYSFSSRENKNGKRKILLSCWAEEYTLTQWHSSLLALSLFTQQMSQVTAQNHTWLISCERCVQMKFIMAVLIKCILALKSQHGLGC